MDCAEVRKFVHAYLDGEFAEDDRVAFAAHLGGCEACRQLADFEQRFKRRLRQGTPPVRAPVGLRVRVAQAIKEADRAERRVRRWRWAAPALAAAAAACVLLTFALTDGERETAGAVVAAQSVRWHRTRVPLDVTGPKIEPIKRFFSDKVPFAVRPLQINSPRARLVGARFSHLRDHPAAYLVYRVGDQRISVFIVDARALRASRGKVRWHGVHGYNVATFVSRGTGYAVASEIDRGRLLKLISFGR